MMDPIHLPSPARRSLADLIEEDRPAAPASPIERLMVALRGRYLLLAFLATALGVAGGFAGWSIKAPTYRSTASIGFEPVMPKVMYATDENRVMPLFDQYVLKQVEMIGSPQVLRKVVEDPEWKTTGLASDEAAIAMLERQLDIESTFRRQNVDVVYVDPNPNVTRIIVSLVVKHYLELHRNEAENSVAHRLETLTERESELQAELDTIREKRLAFSKEYGTDNLAQLYSDQLAEINKLKADLVEFDLAIKLYKSAENAPKEGDAATGVKDQLTVAQIAALDPVMRSYVQQREGVEQEIARMSISYGEEHRELVQAKTLLAQINSKIEQHAKEYMELYRKQVIDQPNLMMRDKVGWTNVASLAQLEERYRLKSALLEKMEAEHQTLWEKKQQMDAIQQNDALIEARLVETQKARDALELESQSSVSGRASVLREASYPQLASNPRRQLAVLGAIAGVCLGIGIVAMIGFTDLRLRSMVDAQDVLGEIHQLGILPQLPEDLADPDQAALTAHCVHRIRTLLQIGTPGSSRRVFAITSPGSQDGKTTMVVALGMSFVVSGSRTLLIDFDIVGGGLSSRTDARRPRRIGRILQREHDLTDGQLDDALALVHERGLRMGEALVELGYVSAEAVEEALAIQPEDFVGILDVADGEPILECVSPSGVEGLFVLPIGSAEPEDVSAISPATARAVIDAACEAFDTVLVDTGPVPGSLEAAQVVGEVDGVLLVVTLNENRKLLGKAMEHLQSVGAKVIGYVFNRAVGRDVHEVAESSMSGSVNQTVGRRRSGRAPVTRVEPPSRLGPIARAVASASGKPVKGASRKQHET
ncbi:MAG: hypothetical protein GC159_08205 [Phycisphaera sp.]|nr:hypothetical protein [Phycisphaera sp.]